jgi:hypothetical protein
VAGTIVSAQIKQTFDTEDKVVIVDDSLLGALGSAGLIAVHRLHRGIQIENQVP